jgi:hypothetical protein
MFELGRELKRFFAAERTRAPSDGLTRGDTSLLELLDARLLAQEAKASDVAAGRVGAKDKPARRLEAAIVWREVARRTGDPVALRKAAAGAEIAATGFDATRRRDGWARARCEQAYCALLGAEIFGDPGLTAAAELAFNEARSSTKGGLAAPLADIGVATLEGRRLLEGSDVAAARAWAARLNPPIAALDTIAKRVPAARALAAEARLIRADLLSGWGARLRDGDLLLHHPFECFDDSVVRFFQQAADDADVTAIAATLYRVGNPSPIVDALVRAAASGKRVAP